MQRLKLYICFPANLTFGTFLVFNQYPSVNLELYIVRSFRGMTELIVHIRYCVMCKCIIVFGNRHLGYLLIKKPQNYDYEI